MRSTIMTFSARSLAEATSAPTVAASPRASRPSGAVPLMGEVSTSWPVRRRNSSGEKDRTAPSGLST